MPPTAVEGLLSGELLLLRALRQIALGRGECRLVQADFQEACGYAGAQALRALEAFVLGLALHSRRKIELHYPGFRGVSGDERLLLEAFGCAQAEAYASARERLRRLMKDEPRFMLMSAAALVAQALEFQGLMIRGTDPDEEGEQRSCGRSSSPAWSAFPPG